MNFAILVCSILSVFAGKDSIRREIAIYNSIDQCKIRSKDTLSIIRVDECDTIVISYEGNQDVKAEYSVKESCIRFKNLISGCVVKTFSRGQEKSSIAVGVENEIEFSFVRSRKDTEVEIIRKNDPVWNSVIIEQPALDSVIRTSPEHCVFKCDELHVCVGTQADTRMIVKRQDDMCEVTCIDGSVDLKGYTKLNGEDTQMPRISSKNQTYSFNIDENTKISVLPNWVPTSE